MIHYQLRCQADHAFDGWFKDSAGFDKQVKRGLLECPVCGTPKVERALMSPALPKKGNQKPAPQPETPVPAKTVVPDRLPAEVRAMLHRLRDEVERNADYVGGEFADEARRIHNGDADARAIYGEASEEDAEALADDGIDIARIPWLPRADS
jgi:hypothetical protein